MEVVFRMTLTACVFGTVAGIVGTGRVTLSLIASGTLMWSFVPALQLLTGLLLISVSKEHAPSLRRYFATGHFWLLWLLGLGVAYLFLPDPALGSCRWRRRSWCRSF